MLEQFLPKQKSEKELFASLVLEESYAAATLWEMDDHGIPHVLAADSAPCAADTWEARMDAVDSALAAVEDAAGTTHYTKAVLGLSSSYLTETGEIKKEIRPEIKTITRELELTPIGFVSIPQALMYKLKKEEGVPPSVILLDVSRSTLSVSLYRVGALTGQHAVARNGDIAIQLEEALKEFKNLEVLPARILLYGQEKERLEESKTELLRYPWTTRVNFLHFPKIEIVSPNDVAGAVSLAGASELSHEVVEAEAEGEEIEKTEEIEEEESNVVAVDPSNLGFKKNVDVLETVEPPAPEKKRVVLPVKMPHLDFSAIKEKLTHSGKGPLIGIGIGIVILITLLYWLVPHATVTVLMLPKAITAAETITIDPTATSVDAQNKIIPGVSQEKSVSGQKTIPVTGKKNVGDPAKGSVTIYNKQTGAKTFAKGSTLTSGSLQFTLDADVQVASASESVGSITFGKANGTITASQIGTESNLPAGTEFHFKDVDTSSAIARNDAALAGGTSKSVTVVSRADYDAFVEAVSTDLVDKAKQDLSTSVRGGEKLIDETIETSVTQKTLNQEIDQEATELSGNATVTVKGVSYNEDDVKTILKAFIMKDIPSGYALAEGRTQVTIANVKVGKNGKISAKATIKADAVPTLNLPDIQKNLAGKSIATAESYLRSIPGVAGMEVRFSLSFGKNKLPLKASNIAVGVAIQ